MEEEKHVTASDDPIIELLSLREPTVFILLSLAQRQKHGYAIIKEVASLSLERIRLSLFPRLLRAAFADEMRDVFAGQVEEAATGGTWPLVGLGLPTLIRRTKNVVGAR
jgi:hypothetical protein